MANDQVHLSVSIELESDPITGAIETTSGPATFTGWMELTAMIELARSHVMPQPRPETPAVRHLAS